MWCGTMTTRPPDLKNLDMITFFFFYPTSPTCQSSRRDEQEDVRALKPGYLIIADHSAKPGDGVSVAKTLHRIEEAP